jgi:hypothetical protein
MEAAHFRNTQKGAHVLTVRDLLDIIPLHVPESERMQATSTEFVQIIDAGFATPIHQTRSTVAVSRHGRVRTVSLLVLDVEFARGPWIDRIEFVSIFSVMGLY